MENLGETLKKQLQSRGMKATTTSIKHIGELEEEITSLKNRSIIDAEFYEANLGWLNYRYEETMPEAKSIILISKPQYATILHFQYCGKDFRVSVPPTYIFKKAVSEVENILAEILSPYGFKVKKAPLPAKLLAVRTGLALYGRNNISYVEGMGSLHRILYFYSDMPLIEDDWEDDASRRVMPECSDCGLCTGACPTKCIDSERFLIHAHRCITNFNEKEADFPEWLDKSWHNSIIGCMRCQTACPKNRDYIHKIEGEVFFTAEETDMILGNVPQKELPYALIQKLDKIDLLDDYGIIGRNLSVLIKRA